MGEVEQIQEEQGMNFDDLKPLLKFLGQNDELMNTLATALVPVLTQALLAYLKSLAEE